MNCDLRPHGEHLRCENCGTIWHRPKIRPDLPYTIMCPGPKREPSGAGTELKKLLAAFGVTEKVGCSCAARAKEMDKNGTEWCRQNVEEIAGWMLEAAKQRGWKWAPRWGVRRLILKAIKNAEHAERDG